jgi:hypothetical protein
MSKYVWVAKDNEVVIVAFDNYEMAIEYSKKHPNLDLVRVFLNPPLLTRWHVRMTVNHDGDVLWHDACTIGHAPEREEAMQQGGSAIHFYVNAVDQDRAIAEAKQLLIVKLQEG